MKKFAKVEDGVVVTVVEADALARLSEGTWVETWDNGGTHKNTAGPGFTYDETLNAFIPPKPHPSWVLDAENYRWNAPVPSPGILTGGDYVWDEATLSWQEAAV